MLTHGFYFRKLKVALSVKLHPTSLFLLLLHLFTTRFGLFMYNNEVLEAEEGSLDESSVYYNLIMDVLSSCGYSSSIRFKFVERFSRVMLQTSSGT